MGQTVSYILRCICGEAEEEEKSEQNLLSYPLNSNSCSKSWIDSSSANNVAKQQFMFNHLDIQISDEKEQFYTQRRSYCINSSNSEHVLQPDNQLVAPSNLVPSIDPSISSSRTGWTLLHEVFDDTLNDFSSFDSSTDEAVLHEFFVDPSTYSPSMDMSNDQALVREPFVDHSIDVPSIDSSTDEALLHEFFADPSTYSPSMDMSNDQALVHEPFVDHSIDVPSIDSSTDEVFLPKLIYACPAFQIHDQFKVTDLNTQVVVDKQVDSPNYSSIIKKWRKREWEKARKEAAVVIERKIKHYSSLQKILLVGEGDFSFSSCLARVFGSASNIVATSLDSTEFLFANYKKALSNICELTSMGGKVMHGVDATEMACNCLLNDSVYDRIIYNFPLVGFFPKGVSRKTQLKRNRRLIMRFLENAKKMITADGEIHITHKSNGFFLEWNLPLLASHVGLRLIEEVRFDFKDYKGYNTKYGFGGDKYFNCNPSKTYKLGFKLQKSV